MRISATDTCSCLSKCKCTTTVNDPNKILLVFSLQKLLFKLIDPPVARLRSHGYEFNTWRTATASLLVLPSSRPPMGWCGESQDEDCREWRG